MLTKKIKLYCSESPVLIENYKLAYEDKKQVWKLHHRNEITPYGQIPRQMLMKLGLWFNRPAEELIFLSKEDHLKLHRESKDFTTDHSIWIAIRFLVKSGIRGLQEITNEDIDGVMPVIRRLRDIFKVMKSNCYTPSSQGYKFYGGIGIGICEEWLNNQEEFVIWAMTNGYRYSKKKRGTQVCRIDKGKDFSPDNCIITINGLII